MSPPLPPSPASHVPAGDLADAAGEPSIGPELPPTDWSVHEQVAAVARARPHHTAVSGGGIRLSYRQPDAWARRIADRLTAAGAGHGSRVGVLRAPSPTMVTAVLGVLRTGRHTSRSIPPTRTAAWRTCSPTPGEDRRSDG
ncbi:AMP-binding protein [Streptomyces lydicus]|nr:AMP-binding protein [Streptomyces lydicus]